MDESSMAALTRNVPDVPEKLVSVKFVRFALSLNPVVFVVHSHYPAKFMPEHPLSNMWLDIHFRQPCYQRPPEVVGSPVSKVQPFPYSINEPVAAAMLIGSFISSPGKSTSL